MSGANSKPAFRLRTLLTGALVLTAAQAAAQPLPPQGRAGECYQQVPLPPTYKMVTKEIPQAPLISYRRTPAVYQMVAKQVLVAKAHTVWTSTPATYKTEPRFKEVPGEIHLVRTAPTYRSDNQRVQVSAEHLEWRRSTSRKGFSGGGEGGVSAIPTGEVMCRILVPARYSWTRHRVMVSPGGYRKVRGPARHVVCYVKVVDTPASRVPHQVAAVYRTVSVKTLVKAATCERISTPRPAKVVQVKVRVGSAGKTWRRITCRHRVEHAAPTTKSAPAPAGPAGGERG